MPDQRSIPSLNGARVLVVQNDPFIAADLDLIIDDAGGEVVALAGSLHDALVLLGQKLIDAAIVDPNLDENEGLVVIEELKRLHIPFVLYAQASWSNDLSAPSSPAASALVTGLAIALKLVTALEQAQFFLI
jgi:DNA-binding NarL/FixJ family response regulator